MSRSSFSKSHEEITNLTSMERTFTIEDADLDKLNYMLKDINVNECPWFEVRDKHGNKAKYYREPHWIPCSERLPEEGREVLLQWKVWKGINTDDDCFFAITHRSDYNYWTGIGREIIPVAWMPLPEPYKGEKQ